VLPANHLRLGVLSEAHKAFVQALQSPDIVGARFASRKVLTEPQILLVHLQGLFDTVLLEQKSA
jgi:hypothetical protein